MTDTRVPAGPDADAPTAPQRAAPIERGNPRGRRRGLTLLAAAVAIAALAWAIMHFFFAPPEEETDDAYVAGDVVSITARDPGTVLAIHADNTQGVKAGQVLIDLDPATADVALASAGADLARAVRAPRGALTQVGGAAAPGVLSAVCDERREAPAPRRKARSPARS